MRNLKKINKTLTCCWNRQCVSVSIPGSAFLSRYPWQCISKESMSAIGVTKNVIGKWWWNAMKTKATKEEKRLAIERGSYHDELPATTVLVDGGWLKRSHKHTYNAMS